VGPANPNIYHRAELLINPYPWQILHMFSIGIRNSAGQISDKLGMHGSLFSSWLRATESSSKVCQIWSLTTIRRWPDPWWKPGTCGMVIPSLRIPSIYLMGDGHLPIWVYSTFDHVTRASGSKPCTSGKCAKRANRIALSPALDVYLALLGDNGCRPTAWVEHAFCFPHLDQDPTV